MRCHQTLLVLLSSLAGRPLARTASAYGEVIHMWNVGAGASAMDTGPSDATVLLQLPGEDEHRSSLERDTNSSSPIGNHTVGNEDSEDEEDDEKHLDNADKSRVIGKEQTEIYTMRRRRRRRQVQVLNKDCWYQVWDFSNYDGAWMNYAMSHPECDDLAAYNNGLFNNMLDSGLFGVSPGCKVTVYDSTDCTGPHHVMADGMQATGAVVKNMNHFEDAAFSDRISSVKCECID